MRLAFVLAVFLGSALIFVVQPMIAKMILPFYGGTPMVWNAAMVFFQGALLVGYGYAHLTSRLLPTGIQVAVHLALLLGAALLLPFGISLSFDPAAWGGSSSWGVILLLATVVGAPFAIVSAGAPLVQKWYGSTSARDASDPYFLYAASNVGSLLALLAYPLVVEPLLTLNEQASFWRWGYWGLVGLLALVGVPAIRSRGSVGSPQQPTAAAASAAVVTSRRRLTWVVLAAVPSSLLLGVTTYLTTNLAAAPLLWVIPLALYLLTYIVAFSRKRLLPTVALGRFAALLLVPMSLVVILEATEPIWALALLHLAVFTVGALYCHQRLADDRPEVTHLTEFYLWIAVGGVVGGIFNALLAPSVFATLAEYPIALVALAALRLPEPSAKGTRSFDFAFAGALLLLSLSTMLFVQSLGVLPGPMRTGITIGLPLILGFLAVDRPIRYALSLGAVFLAAHLTEINSPGNVILSHRSFFGVHRVISVEGKFHSLFHGNTAHGKQNLDPAKATNPLAYYHPTGPIGQLMGGTRRFSNVGLVGLGVGSLAAYGRPGDKYAYFEIDPIVISIANDPKLFTFLRDTQAEVRIVEGDARLTIRQEPDSSFDLIVLDAFSSDSIPIHVITREALALYLAKLQPGGLIAIHISNRYIDLQQPLAHSARELGLRALVRADLDVEGEEAQEGKDRSTWVALARDEADFGELNKDARWLPLDPLPWGRAWTDDYSNIVMALYLVEEWLGRD
ncbi:MAG TPA: fused MFS/spermidine synthase [Fimbriimonadaceae bacterium]|nr:fused MFS/spermidine synthase [Fimbriimonadaceae bacterium]